MAVLVLLAVVLWGVLQELNRPRLTVLDAEYWAGVARQSARQVGG